MKSTIFDIEVQFQHQTDAAVCVRATEDGEDIWLPKSRCEIYPQTPVRGIRRSRQSLRRGPPRRPDHAGAGDSAGGPQRWITRRKFARTAIGAIFPQVPLHGATTKFRLALAETSIACAARAKSGMGVNRPTPTKADRQRVWSPFRQPEPRQRRLLWFQETDIRYPRSPVWMKWVRLGPCRR